jgi:hypothetical protein
MLSFTSRVAEKQHYADKKFKNKKNCKKITQQNIDPSVVT